MRSYLKAERLVGRVSWSFLFVILLGMCLRVSAKEIKMVTVDWAPYYSQSLPQKGVISEIVDEAFKRVGHTTQLEFLPWERAMRSALRGDYDVLMGAYYSEMREVKLEYSDPIYEVEVGIIARKDLEVTHYKKLEDLTSYRFGIGLGWVNSPEFDTAHFLRKEAVSRPILNLRKMEKRHIDMTVMSTKVFEYELAQSELEGKLETVVLQPLLAKNPLYVCVPRIHPKSHSIIADFNRGLRLLKKDGSYAKILKKHGFDTEH
ncbi:hypothetical protein Rhal01_03079 [Rubritalea halochordaticola]|uniref:Solute-binding protein family 3/N-terminal domain-containing protein n=1 Tax=Rubritalea halochordaticola TaxID=714537 RepID=A0ABP9V2J5_9BACT